MAKILTFRPAESKGPEIDNAACEGLSAEVIIFPGIRYERWSDECETQLETTSARRKRAHQRRRDVLELAK